jgi:hypothetical protein
MHREQIGRHQHVVVEARREVRDRALIGERVQHAFVVVPGEAGQLAGSEAVRAARTQPERAEQLDILEAAADSVLRGERVRLAERCPRRAGRTTQGKR